MADGYAAMGEPTMAAIVGHHEGSKNIIYQYTATPSPSAGGQMGLAAALNGGVGIDMILSAPTPEDVFPPGPRETKAEKQLAASQILYRHIDMGKVPGNNRCREVFGFNMAKSSEMAYKLLSVYAVAKEAGIYPKEFGMWRNMACVVKNFEKLCKNDKDKSHLSEVKGLLRGLDVDMQGKSISLSNT
jgi:hypothetical protein